MTVADAALCLIENVKKRDAEITDLKNRLALSEARLAAIHELLGEINELFEKAKEILEGDDV